MNNKNRDRRSLEELEDDLKYSDMLLSWLKREPYNNKVLIQEQGQYRRKLRGLIRTRSRQADAARLAVDIRGVEFKAGDTVYCTPTGMHGMRRAVVHSISDTAKKCVVVLSDGVFRRKHVGLHCSSVITV